MGHSTDAVEIGILRCLESFGWGKLVVVRSILRAGALFLVEVYCGGPNQIWKTVGTIPLKKAIVRFLVSTCSLGPSQNCQLRHISRGYH